MGDRVEAGHQIGQRVHIESGGSDGDEDDARARLLVAMHGYAGDRTDRGAGFDEGRDLVARGALEDHDTPLVQTVERSLPRLRSTLSHAPEQSASVIREAEFARQVKGVVRRVEHAHGSR